MSSQPKHLVPNYYKVRVLIAESATQVQSALLEIINGLGCEIKKVNNREEIVRSLKHGVLSYTPFHLLILDEQLLGSDSKPVLQKIRQEPGLQNVKAILLSSTPQPLNAAPETDATFDAWLLKPVRASDIMDALQKILGLGFASSETPQLKGHILVVEDDELSRELLKILLTKHGYAVTLALNGLEALTIFKATLFDLVLMDLQMPEMDGVTTAQRIREMEAGQSRVPVVALTASNIPTNSPFQFKRDIDAILTKPFQIQTLLQVIESHIGKSTSQIAGQSTSTTGTGQAVVMDVQNALPHFGLDPEQYTEIFGEFQLSLPGRMAEMEKAFNAKDFAQLARLAHNLKGVAANVGAMRLSEYSAQLDEQCDNAQLEQIAQTLEAIRNAMEWLQANAIHLIENYLSSTQDQTRAE